MTEPESAEQHQPQGRVWLVGAGPGDPGLITRLGHELLATADVILHDRLGTADLLADAAPKAELIDVGKSPKGPSASQHDINQLLIAHARQGRSVVRLKGGDPFIYGRGSEELEACRDAGVPCTLVPGVSSALAAPLAANIPLTHRGLARSFAVATPRVAAVNQQTGEPTDPLDYDALARLDTIVLLMAVSEIPAVAEGLARAGLNPETPAAIIENATTPDQRVIRSTLRDLPHDADQHDARPPAVLVIGRTVGLFPDDTARTAGPLAGRTVVITRPEHANARLAAALAALGATPLRMPLIEIVYPDRRAIASKQLNPRDHDWIVFTSLHGVRGFRRLLDAHALDARALAPCKLAAVGPRTADELISIGLRADLLPDEHRAAALVRDMIAALPSGSRVLFPAGTLARDELPEGLRAAGFTVTEIDVYETRPKPLAHHQLARIAPTATPPIDALLLYSPSAARGLAASLSRAGSGLDHALVACVGPTTAEAARDAGLRVDLVPKTYGDHGMIDELVARFAPTQPA